MLRISPIMTINPNNLVRIFIAIFLITMTVIAYQVYQHVMFLQTQRRQLIHKYSDPNIENFNYDAIINEELRNKRINRFNILKMKANIKRINLKQRVYIDEFLHNITNVTYVIVIQVHSNVYLLKQLITSMKAAHSISNALLIFSHDTFDSKINDAVKKVNFARYMQIFYPYTVQLYPHVYPGQEIKIFLLNTTLKDKFKQRDPIAVQKKLHWWWQMNQVFDHLQVIKNFTKKILFLDEDNYVTEDFLVVLKILDHVRELHCPVCEFLSLGAHKRNASLYLNQTALIALEVWDKDMSNIGLAFDRNIWHRIKDWGWDFCSYNDYTWAHSLKYIGLQHLDINFYLAAIMASRVFRIEGCEKGETICMSNEVEEVRNFTKAIHHALYPSSVTLKVLKSQDYIQDTLGLFSDQRDINLCMYFTENSVWF